ncbi:MAG: SDR family NAD(P)-dependent oxidoreductase [Spirochaetia bacterium]|nr:SDR family NAD(P)-dependent oxidoreductase [Spirochaetia bacterium]
MKSQGNTILITGGGSGIGLALAEAFKKRGDTVVVANRSEDKLKKASQLGFKTYRMNMADAADIESTARKILTDFPGLNGVIHNAGIMRAESLTSGASPETQTETIATNLLGPMLLNNIVIPELQKQSSAFIMTVTSGLAFIPMAMFPTYCASKAALHSYTESLRTQLKGTSIQVTELAPPYVQTRLTGAEQENDPTAMPLDEFILEVMDLIKKNPDAAEILVNRVRPLRFAAGKGPEEYERFYAQLNGG